MRLVPLAALALLVGCGPGIDPLIGSYPFAVTAMDTNTGSSSTNNTSGTGTLAVTANALMTGYVITAAQNEASPCVVEAIAAEKATSPELTFKADQKCVFTNGGTVTTVTFSSGKGVLKLGDTRDKDVMTLDVVYAYTGVTTIFNISSSFSGSGKRTYIGTKR